MRKWGTVCLAVAWLLLGGADAAPAGAALSGGAAAAEKLYEEGVGRLRAGKPREAIPLLYQATLRFPDNRRVAADYVIALAWAGEYHRAAAYYLGRERELQEVGYLHRHIAKALYEVGQVERARELYERAWRADPGDQEAFKGLIYSWARLGKLAEAVAVWAAGSRQRRLPPAVLAEMKVFLLEKSGASEAALEAAREANLGEEDLRARLKGDKAVNRLRWEELDQALAILEEQLAKDPGNLRARQDYIVALRKQDRMTEVLQNYEELRRRSPDIPYWVHEAVADAYLYLRQPWRAAVFYQEVLRQNPEEPFEALKGLFYCEVERRRWPEAAAVLRQLEEYIQWRRKRLEGKFFSASQAKQFEYEANEATRLRGLFYLYQDQNRKAEEHFREALAQAGLVTGFRNGLAQALSQQLKPRRALEHYRIAHGIDEQDLYSQIGMAWALHALNYKEEARRRAAELFRRHPTHAHVIDLYETLKTEGRPYLQWDYYFTKEYPGSSEHYLVSELNVPLRPRFRVFWQQIWQEGREDRTRGVAPVSAWNRMAGGFDWIVHPTLTWRQAVSFDYRANRDPGTFTRLVWRPLDALKFTAEFDSYSLALPLRARTADIEAMQAVAAVDVTPSDLRDFGLKATLNLFSDTNRNIDLQASFNQTVINHPEVKVRMGLRAGYSRYTKNQVPYFSPLFVYNLLFTPTIHWTQYHYYDRHLRLSFYPRVGLHKQIGYEIQPVAGLTVEYLLKWSRKFSLTANVSYDLRVYDGEYTHVLGVYAGFKKYF